MTCAATEQRLKNAASEAKALREESHRKLPGATKLRKAIDDRARKMEGLQKRINEIEDRIFAAFSKKVSLCSSRVPVNIRRTCHCTQERVFQ